MTGKEENCGSEDLEMMLFEAIPSLPKDKRAGYLLITGGAELYEIEMDVLAKAFTYVFHAPVTFKEEGGPGGVISDVTIHWDQVPTDAATV